MSRVWVTRRVYFTRAGMGLGEMLYPPVLLGPPAGMFLLNGGGFGVVKPNGYRPIAIFSQMVTRATEMVHALCSLKLNWNFEVIN